MITLLTGIAVAAVTALLTFTLKQRSDQRQASVMARREFYVELMTLLVGRRRSLERLSMYPEMAPPPDIEEDRLNRFDALRTIDSSPEISRLAEPCFGLLNRFWASYTARAPIEVDQHGLYRYRRDLVQDMEPEAAALVVRLALGEIYTEFSEAVDKVGLQIRREVHGKKAAVNPRGG